MSYHKDSLKLRREELRYELQKLKNKYGTKELMQAIFDITKNPTQTEHKQKSITTQGRWQE